MKTITIKPNDAGKKALDLLRYGGETDDLEVIDCLALVAPFNTVFKRTRACDLSLERLTSMLKHGFDPR